MSDLDDILSVIENPTRRRILEVLVREPHYPLQLSKELGVSQQAIVKNLEVMERSGLVTSYRESSNIGPDRIFYKPNDQFTITIDMRDGMFKARITRAENDKCQTDEAEERSAVDVTADLENIRKQISDIDSSLAEIEDQRNTLLMTRNALIESYYRKQRQAMDYAHRNMLYELLNNPAMDGSALSRELGMNEALVIEMMNEMMRMIRE